MATLFGVKGWAASVMVLIGLIAVAVISRNWSCRQSRPPRPPRPPRTATYAVAEVPNGATIVVKAGLLGRRTATVTLESISAPAEGDGMAEASRANLERLAGSTIRVETARNGLFRGESDEEANAEPIEARGPLVGVVYGESGECLNLAQVRDGFATCLPDAPKEWKKQETEAKKARRGIWAKEGR